MTTDTVIVAGAGPVGLITALGLARQGISVTVLEKNSGLDRDTRAAAFHSPSLDIFDELGFLDSLMEVGHKLPDMRMSDKGLGRRAILPFDILSRRGITKHAYDFVISQHLVTRAAYEACDSLPEVTVLFDHEVDSLSQDADSVELQVKTADGTQDFSTHWLVGADGANSAVRRGLGLGFEGFTWPDRFLLLEVDVDMTEEFGPAEFIANGPDWRLVLKIPYGPGADDWTTRVVSSIPEDMSDEEAIARERVEAVLQDTRPSPAPYELARNAIYAVHQRVADTFYTGRVTLAGDAAHINSPLGGMGLNSGIHDAMNLVEKLAGVISGEGGTELLELYDRQRRGTTVEHIQKTSIENKKRQQETDLEKRKQAMDMFEKLAVNEEGLLAFSKKWQMYDSLEFAAGIE